MPNKTKTYQRKKVFIITENYIGKTPLSQILADLLYTRYKHQLKNTKD